MSTIYHEQTPQSLRDLLERIRLNGWRVHFYWGDTETGQDWGDMYDVTGKLGRSTGPKKIPILLHNSRSLGGTHIQQRHRH